MDLIKVFLILFSSEVHIVTNNENNIDWDFEYGPYTRKQIFKIKTKEPFNFFINKERFIWKNSNDL